MYGLQTSSETTENLQICLALCLNLVIYYVPTQKRKDVKIYEVEAHNNLNGLIKITHSKFTKLSNVTAEHKAISQTVNMTTFFFFKKNRMVGTGQLLNS